MANPKDQLPEALAYIPWWRKVDPGPPWLWAVEEISQEARVQLAVSQLQFEKEVASAHVKAIDRNIAILNATGAKKA